jgi:acyl-CoA thioester hydrolase
MNSFSTTLRVRYAETDQMGFVYYGNYAAYYETGRVELLRQMGTTYRQLEESGVLMPVTQLVCNFYRPAKYDDLLTITTSIKSLTETRIEFEYSILNEEGVELNKGFTQLAFISKHNMRPCRIPDWFKSLILSYSAL